MDVLNGNDDDVIRQLQTRSATVNDRFGYTARYRGRVQPCAGNAIHLAASRGHLSTVQLLLEWHASIDSMVQRDDVDHYDVIHAAVFREGRGGCTDIINYLCSQGADINSVNADGHSCLHLAFRTGNVETIRAVQQAGRMGHAVQSEQDADVNFESPSRLQTPLEFGIQFGKLSTQALAELAPINGSSLRTFIHQAPECIPTFLSCALEKQQSGGRMMQLMAHQLTSKELAQLLRDRPEVAAALLNMLTATPEAMGSGPAGDEGWHQRVSFAPRAGVLRLFRSCLQFQYQPRLVFYESDTAWLSDAYEAPDWHHRIIEVKDPPMLEASFWVCYVPNLISPTIFSALSSHAGGPAAESVFGCRPIQAAVLYAFWNGAVWTDSLQFFASLWGLVLLVLETMSRHELSVESDKRNFDAQMNEGVFGPGFLAGSQRCNIHLNEGLGLPRRCSGVVADWMVAKGVVDLVLEAFQLYGCAVTFQVSSYFNAGNLWDLIRSILPLALVVGYQYRLLHLLIVLIYWMRLWEGLVLTPSLGPALLPFQHLLNPCGISIACSCFCRVLHTRGNRFNFLHILSKSQTKQLRKGLLPALMFTVMCFAALTHAMYTVQVSPSYLWPETIYDVFTKLIVQGLPEQLPEDRLELMLLYGGVLFFSIFVLNIFIGVIGEQYSNERDLSTHKFLGLRASSCLTFMLRASVIPCDLCSPQAARLLGCTCAFAALLLQILALAKGWQLPGIWQLYAFVACQMTMFLSVFQCRGMDTLPWASSTTRGYKELDSQTGRSQRQRYLWIIEPRQDLEPPSLPGGQSGPHHEAHEAPSQSFSRSSAVSG